MRLSEFTRLHLRLGAAIAVLLATGLLLTHAGSVPLDAIPGLADSFSFAQNGRPEAKTLVFAAPDLELRDLAQRF